jgi:uncharacterized membrane protein
MIKNTIKLNSILNHTKTLLQRPEYVFTIIASLAGLVMIFLMPPFMVPDEFAHFDRSYQVAQGHVTSQTMNGVTGGLAPIINIKTTDTHHVPLVFDTRYFSPISKNNDVFTKFPNSAVYSPVAYLPQAIGIKIAQLSFPSIGLMLIFGRLLNLAVYIVLIFISIRIAKQGKWVYVVVGLFPMAIQQAASLSSDVMTIALAFLTISLIHGLFLQPNAISKKQGILLIMLAIMLGLTKQTNVILLLPVFFLPLRLFGDWKRKTLFIATVYITALASLLSWYLVTVHLHYDIKFSPYNVNQAEQLSLVLQHPLGFLKLLFHTFVYEGTHGSGIFMADFFMSSLVGFFSWLSYKLPLFFIITEYILLFISLLYRDEKNESDNRSVGFSILQLLTYLAYTVAIGLVLYLTWTTVGSTQIDGIQGRYFIPLLPLLIAPFVLLSKYIKILFKKSYQMGLLVAVVATANLITMMLLTYDWFYH